MRPYPFALPLLLAGLLSSGCAALPETTLGHRCGIPDGVGCLSTQEVYDRTVAGSLPGLKPRNEQGGVTPSLDHDPAAPRLTQDGPRMLRTSALYTPPEELRIWVNRWRDQDGDLHDDSFIYVVLGEGRWLVRD
jgi:conjugal transfer pilus assembly protein TraV